MSRNDGAVICVIAGALVAMSGQDGWGWFLFIAFLLYDERGTK